MANIEEEPQAPNRQPNWEIFLQSLRNITVEAALIPNVPAFNQGDQIQPDLDRLSQEVVALQKRQDTLQQGQDALQRDQATIKQRQDALKQELVVLNHRLDALPVVVQELTDEIRRQ